MLARHVRMQLNQLKGMSREIEVRQAMRANLDIRNKWMQANTVKNYQTEHDRIRKHLNNITMPHTTKAVVLQRKQTLEALGAKAFDVMR